MLRPNHPSSRDQRIHGIRKTPPPPHVATLFTCLQANDKSPFKPEEAAGTCTFCTGACRPIEADRHPNRPCPTGTTTSLGWHHHIYPPFGPMILRRRLCALSVDSPAAPALRGRLPNSMYRMPPCAAHHSHDQHSTAQVRHEHGCRTPCTACRPAQHSVARHGTAQRGASCHGTARPEYGVGKQRTRRHGLGRVTTALAQESTQEQRTLGTQTTSSAAHSVPWLGAAQCRVVTR